SIATLHRPFEVWGLPGIGTLQNLSIPPGKRVIVFCDGDDPETDKGKAAIAGRIRGLDHLLLGGAAAVRVTETPIGADANSILRDAEDGSAEVPRLLASAKPAKLSFAGEILRLSRLDEVDYAQQRRLAAKDLGVPVALVDKKVNELRPRRAGAEYEA